MTCPCDQRVFPAPLAIPAGLTELPRQIAGFPELRAALLAAAGRHPALAGWRARGSRDLGVMLLEMWAVLCDAVSFYDQVLAHEAYLRTARLEDSVRRLVEVLGYQPRPAVAAEVELVALVEGNRPVELPAGAAFRSGAFDGQPPQLFELLAPAIVHPWHNRWPIAPVRPTAAGDSGGPGTSPTALYLAPVGATARAGDVVLVATASAPSSHDRARWVSSVERVRAGDGATYARVTFSSPISLAADTALSDVVLHRAGRTARLWTLPTESGSSPAISSDLTELVLDGLVRSLAAGDRVVLERAGELRWFVLDAVDEVQQKVKAGTDGDGNTLYGWLVATRLTLDTSLNDPARRDGGSSWSSSDAALITVHHGLQPAGTATAPAATTLSDDDQLVIAGEVREDSDVPLPGRFALVDADARAVLVSGALDPATGALARDGTDPGWEEPLTAPVEALGNVITAVRGETVAHEVLGSGDASLANQRFVLAKAPLTYRAAATAGNPSGVASSLQVRVAGVLWREVPSFFGAGPDDQVYVVRTDADGVATVLFGDGINGARLPTGTDNVVASYRFGAGAASPPAGSITQLARPVAHLTSISQPADALGGADAEPADHVRALAPRSALVLGRAVSILDMEALAAAVPGVRAVQTTWGWQGVQQRPTVQCWVVGTPLEGAVEERLRSMTETTTPIAVNPADGLWSRLFLEVDVDERYVAQDVLDQVFELLAAPATGLLRPEVLGVGRPIYRSRLSAAVLGVPGAQAVRYCAMMWFDRSGAFHTWHEGYGASPGTGAYFDFEAGGIQLNGEDRHLG